MTDAATTRTAANVATVVTATASPILDETWHPRGLVLTSHLSSGCGQISPLKTGARNGIACSFGTHDQVYASKSQYSSSKNKANYSHDTKLEHCDERENPQQGFGACKDKAHIRAPTAAEAIQAPSTSLLSPASLEMLVHRFSSREITIEDFESRVM